MTKLQRTVLVIDQQEEARLAIRQALRQAPGIDYLVNEAANGAQALAYLRQQQPDCLLLADQVAGSDGLTLLQQIVQQTAPHSCPIILLVDAAAAASALPAGVHDFLLKTEVAAFPVQRALNHALDKVALLRQVAEQRAFTQMMLESTPDCVKLLDAEGRLLSMNTPGLCLMEIDDFTPLAGQPWTALWPVECSKLIHAALVEARAGRQGRFQAFCPTAKGTPKWWDVIVTAVNPVANDEADAPVRFIAASRDITESYQWAETLRTSEERQRLGIAVAGLIIVDIDYTTDRVRLGPEAATLFGWPMDVGAVPRASFYALFHPADRDEFLRRIDIAHDPLGPGWFAMEQRIVRPTGETRWLRVRKQVFFTQSATGGRCPHHALLAAIDITETKQREAEQHFLADLGEMMVGIQDPDELLWRVAQRLGEFLTVSRSFFTEVDRQQAQLIIHRNYHQAALPSLAGVYPLADFDPRHLAAHEAGQLVVLADIPPAAIAATGNPERYAPTQIQAMVSAPLLRNGQWTATLIVSDHQPRPWTESEIGLIQTVAERAWLAVENRRLFQETKLLLAQVQEGQQFLQKSEETARQRLAELEAIYDSAPIGLCVLDRNLRWVRINERLAEINGFPVQAHLGRSVRELLPDLAPTAEPILRMILADDQPMLNLELQGETPAQPGVERTWVEHMFPLHDSDGAVIGINIVAEEITERKRQERRLQELNATLERRVAERTQELEQKNQELERSNRELDKFAYVASHDLKSPLRAIDNLSQWIKEDAGALLPEPSQEHLAKLQGRVRRMEKLLDDLLVYSRVGRLQYAPEVVDLKALLQNLIALLQPSTSFTITVAEPLPTLRTQRVPLETVLRNLIDNAIKHHDRADGHVQIAAYDRGDWIEFVIDDDGPGIDPQFHNRIFEVFQTLQPRDKVEGSGMGLAIVKKSIENQGGTITVKSAPGAGATFRFTWGKG